VAKPAGPIRREYGPADLIIDNNADLFPVFRRTNYRGLDEPRGQDDGLPKAGASWHTAPFGPSQFADPTATLLRRAVSSRIAHTPRGREIPRQFVFRVCHCRPDWTMGHFIETSVKKSATKSALAACSVRLARRRFFGAATLIHRAIKDGFICVFVNNGLLRKKSEASECALYLPKDSAQVFVTRCQRKFLAALRDRRSEIKRKRIGNKFIEVFEEEAGKLGAINIWRKELFLRTSSNRCRSWTIGDDQVAS